MFQTHHDLAVQDEQVRANEAEHNLSASAAQNEIRVSSLESNLSELSEVVGKYEKLRQQVHRKKPTSFKAKFCFYMLLFRLLLNNNWFSYN